MKYCEEVADILVILLMIILNVLTVLLMPQSWFREQCSFTHQNKTLCKYKIDAEKY